MYHLQKFPLSRLQGRQMWVESVRTWWLRACQDIDAEASDHATVAWERTAVGSSMTVLGLNLDGGWCMCSVG